MPWQMRREMITMMKKLILLAGAAALCLNTFAQDENYKEQYESGYRGGYIKGIKLQEDALDFIVVGDWGRQGEYFQKAVAGQMASAATSLDLDFVISTGDNFYPDGVASVQDPLWRSSFEEVYRHFPLQKKWYVVLGNHDYRTNPQAEVDYSKTSARWVMPDRYFSKKFTIDDNTAQQVLIAFIDTNPLVSKHYKDDVYGPKVQTQDTAAQLQWLRTVLSDTSANIKWKIVVGHHPLYSGGKRRDSKDTKDVNDRLKAIFDQYKVDVYLAGHEHHLEYVKPQGATHYITSGAGSEVRPVKLLPGIGKFAAAQAGFVTFSILPHNLLLQFIDHQGKILYASEIKK